MRVIYNKTAGILSEAVRSRLKRTSFEDADRTTKMLSSIFPRQLVSAKGGRVQVTKEDGSLVIAVLHDGRRETSWVESAVNLRMTIK
jgi:hypothetical protein